MSGFAAVWGSQWFLGVWHAPFPPQCFPDDHWEFPPQDYSSDFDINILELWPVLLAAKKWGSLWKGRKIRVYTDNTQVMSMVNTGRSTSVPCMFWLRELFWLSVVYNFHLVASYIKSEHNVLQDFLSCLFDPKRKARIPYHLIWDLCC